MAQKHFFGPNRRAGRVMGLLMALVMLCSVFMPVYAADEVDLTGARVTIVDTIAENGRLVAKVTDSGGKVISAEQLRAEGCTITWAKNGAEVTRKEVTTGVYNMAEDGSWVNVAYDEGAGATYTVTVSKAGAAAVTANMTVPYYASIQNGSFEKPVNTSGYQVQYPNGTSGIVWKTTGPGTGGHKGNDIEIVNTSSSEWSNLSLKWHGIAKAADGNQYAELNAEAEGSLYQDVLTSPGATMYWQLAHCARLRNDNTYYRNPNGTYKSDTMYVVIMDATKASALASNQSKLKQIAPQLAENYSGTRSPDAQAYYDAGARSYKCTSNQYNVWTWHNGQYVVPANQYLTRYFFVSVEYASGDPTIGNQLDKVFFDTKLPPPIPGTGRVTVTKNVYGLDLKTVRESLNKSFISYGGNSEVTFEADSWESLKDSNGDSYISASYVIDGIEIPANTNVNYTFTEDSAKAAVSGYDLSADQNQTVTLTKENNDQAVTFTNTYTRQTGKLTINKVVTGGLGDKTKEFEFSYSYTVDGTPYNGTFTLKDSGQKALNDIPVGTEVTITETNYADQDYTTRYAVGNGNAVSGNTCTITIEKGDNTVTFTNQKDVNPDTGVLLDSLPYMLILAVAAAGAVSYVAVNRKSRDND